MSTQMPTWVEESSCVQIYFAEITSVATRVRAASCALGCKIVCVVLGFTGPRQEAEQINLSSNLGCGSFQHEGGWGARVVVHDLVAPAVQFRVGLGARRNRPRLAAPSAQVYCDQEGDRSLCAGHHLADERRFAVLRSVIGGRTAVMQGPGDRAVAVPGDTSICDVLTG